MLIEEHFDREERKRKQRKFLAINLNTSFILSLIVMLSITLFSPINPSNYRQCCLSLFQGNVSNEERWTTAMYCVCNNTEYECSRLTIFGCNNITQCPTTDGCYIHPKLNRVIASQQFIQRDGWFILLIAGVLTFICSSICICIVDCIIRKCNIPKGYTGIQ